MNTTFTIPGLMPQEPKRVHQHLTANPDGSLVVEICRQPAIAPHPLFRAAIVLPGSVLYWRDNLMFYVYSEPVGADKVYRLVFPAGEFFPVGVSELQMLWGHNLRRIPVRRADHAWAESGSVMGEPSTQLPRTETTHVEAPDQFVFQQASPATTWTIVHGLEMHPNVTTTDADGAEMEGVVEYQDDNTVVIRFSPAAAGWAYLS